MMFNLNIRQFFILFQATASCIHQVHRVQSPEACCNTSFINMAQLGPQHLTNMLVRADCILVTNNVAKYPELADNIHKLSLLSWPDHVVGGDRGLDPVHQDEGIPLLRVLDVLQKGFDVSSIHIVTASLSLRL